MQTSEGSVPALRVFLSCRFCLDRAQKPGLVVLFTLNGEDRNRATGRLSLIYSKDFVQITAMNFTVHAFKSSLRWPDEMR